jgi:hypothetical protein
MFELAEGEVNFEHIVACFKLLGAQFDGDKLYEEFASLRKIRTALNEEENRTDLKWVHFFKQCHRPELLKLL